MIRMHCSCGAFLETDNANEKLLLHRWLRLHKVCVEEPPVQTQAIGFLAEFPDEEYED